MDVPEAGIALRSLELRTKSFSLHHPGDLGFRLNGLDSPDTRAIMELS